MAANVAAAISNNNFSLDTVAQAADIHVVDLESRLEDGDFTVNDLVRVGGFLRIPVARFMEGTAAC